MPAQRRQRIQAALILVLLGQRDRKRHREVAFSDFIEFVHAIPGPAYLFEHRRCALQRVRWRHQAVGDCLQEYFLLPYVLHHPGKVRDSLFLLAAKQQRDRPDVGHEQHQHQAKGHQQTTAQAHRAADQRAKERVCVHFMPRLSDVSAITGLPDARWPAGRGNSLDSLPWRVGNPGPDRN
ncbi:hypothetical protein D3C76_562720 [compost metagenome]